MSGASVAVGGLSEYSKFGFYLDVGGIGQGCQSLTLDALKQCQYSRLWQTNPLQCWGYFGCDFEPQTRNQPGSRFMYSYSALNRDEDRQRVRMVRNPANGAVYVGFFPYGVANRSQSLILRMKPYNEISFVPLMCLKGCYEPLGRCVDGSCRCKRKEFERDGDCVCKYI